MGEGHDRQMSDKEDGGPLITLTADASGGMGVSLGTGMLSAIARIRPFKGRFKGAAEKAIAAQVLAKITADPASLDEADLEFVEDMLSDRSKKYLRLKAVAERAEEFGASDEGKLLLEAVPDAKETEGENKRTADDWVNRFREDALSLPRFGGRVASSEWLDVFRTPLG